MEIKKQVKAEIKASLILGWKIFKGIFKTCTVYHRCPYCNLVIQEYQKKCDRCNCEIGWENES